MKGLLRADRIRLRHRRDLLIITLAVPILALVGYINGFLSIGSQFGFDPEFGPPPEIVAAIAAERQRYAFPQSILTLLGSSSIGLLALAYLGAATVGDEFGWSTIRTSLLASSDRVRFLLSRFAALGVVAGWLIGSLLLLGLVLPFVLKAVGADLSASAGVDTLGTLGYLGALMAVSFAILSFGILMALLARSGPGGLLIAVIYTLVESALGGLPVWQRDDVLGWVPSVLFARGATTLLDQANRAASAVRPLDVFLGDQPLDQPQPHVLPVPVGILVILAWGALFAAAALVRIRRMDIPE